MSSLLQALAERSVGAAGETTATPVEAAPGALRPRRRSRFEDRTSTLAPPVLSQEAAETPALTPKPPRPRPEAKTPALLADPARPPVPQALRFMPPKPSPPESPAPNSTPVALRETPVASPHPREVEPPRPAPQPPRRAAPQTPLASPRPPAVTPPLSEPVVARAHVPRPEPPVEPIARLSHPVTPETKVALRIRRREADEAPPAGELSPRKTRDRPSPPGSLRAPLRPALPPATPPPVPPHVNVHIGRIEVRAMQAPPPSPRRADQAPKLSLDDYLKTREGAR